MKYLQAVAQKFALYLYQNNHFHDNFTISITEVTKLFTDFKKEFKLQMSFDNLLHKSRSLLKFGKGETLIYNQKQMVKLRNKEAEIDTMLNTRRPPRKENKKGNSSPSSSNGSDKESADKYTQGLECRVCGIKFEDKKQLDNHISGRGHSFLQDLSVALKQNAYHPHLKFTINDSPLLDNVILRKDEPKTISLTAHNSGNKAIAILEVKTNPDTSEVDFKPTVVPYKLLPDEVIFWKLRVHCKNEGVLSFPILITIEKTKKLLRKHLIELVFHTHSDIFDDLHPVKPFKREFKDLSRSYLDLIDYGSRSSPQKETRTSVPLKDYLIPQDLFGLLNSNFQSSERMPDEQKAQLEYIKGLILEDNKKGSLTVPHNYVPLLKTLLHAEELQQLKNMKSYDLENQTFARAKGLLELQVPDLAERRPSILVGDTVQVRSWGYKVHVGVIHRVTENSIFLKMPHFFMAEVFQEKGMYNVSFTFNRYCLRTQHQAVELTKSDNIEHVFFPRRLKNPPKDLSVELEWFNKDIECNPQQQQAVRAILKKASMPAPYLIYGPPGTGKTMTVVECVKQIFARTEENVLICAPSNSAGNEIAHRLKDTIPKKALFRYVAQTFSDFMPEDLLEYSNCADNCFYQPAMAQLTKYRIVITTLVTAAKFVNFKCPKNHFSYVFIDEAGQATEAETMIPIARILSNKDKTGWISGQIILAGDPRQLGPVIQSTLGKECGFDTSTLERLIDTCKLYSKNENNEYNPFALTKLLKNYRSHSAIIHVPNQLFYDNELQVAGDDTINTALNWPGLPNKDFPMVFHSVIGSDQREESSPSYFNIQEIQVVADYLDQLVGKEMNGVRISQNDVMIISPYKKQVEKIRKICERKHFYDICVGSVEQIQGQERLIVILSTVRSQPQLLRFDEKFHLGFLNNPKRFNVAITRPKALLIVIGNPNLLKYDKYWKTLIEYCKNNGAMIGDNFEGESDETLSDAQNMSLFHETEPEEGLSSSAEI